MQKELVVALFDVLGFEDRIGRCSLDEIHGQYKDLLSIAASKGSHAFFDARPTGDGSMVPFFGFIDIEQDYFSDTILMWSPFRPSMLKPFLHVCSSFMCETLRAELPIRGAIALGAGIMDKSARTYIGPPLVEAARAEKAQQWIGLGFGPSFRSRKDVPFSADLVRPYEKHRKPDSGEMLPGLVVDWPRAWRKEYGNSAVHTLERLSQSGKQTDYYRHTIEFVRHSDANPDWWKSYQQEKRSSETKRDD